MRLCDLLHIVWSGREQFLLATGGIYERHVVGPAGAAGAGVSRARRDDAGAAAEIAVQMDAMLPRWFQVFLGVAEVLAAIGLTLPGVTRISGLVPAAAAGVMVVMVSATALHLARSEFSAAATTCVLLVVATFVAYGRWRLPIAPRRTAT